MDLTSLVDTLSRTVAVASTVLQRHSDFTHISYTQLNLDPNSGKIRDATAILSLTKPGTREWMAVHALHQLGNPVVEFDQSLALICARVAIVGESCAAEMQARRFLPAFILLRALVEQATVLVETNQKLGQRLAIGCGDNPVEYVTSLDQIIASAAFAMRFNWQDAASVTELAALGRKDREYIQDENGLSLRGQVMNAIDAADKICSGIRSAYEVLCEFAHPNIGASWLVSTDTDIHHDSRGMRWIRRRVSAQPSNFGLQSPAPAFDAALVLVQEFFSAFPSWIDQYDAYRSAIVQAVQNAIRTTGRGALGLLDKYEACPCRSGKKVRFCCAAKRSS
jgi:hypothetical protein